MNRLRVVVKHILEKEPMQAGVQFDKQHMASRGDLGMIGGEFVCKPLQNLVQNPSEMPG